MQHPPTAGNGAGERTLSTTRLEAFSDGVFAIAITLLILEVRVPERRDIGEGRQLLTALADLWPAYLAYGTSFVAILIMWVNHHIIFEHVRRTDHPLFLLNGLLLLCITFMPFPTALLAEYLGHPGQRLAAAVYAGSFVVIAIVFNLLWHYAIRRPHLLNERTSRAFIRRFTWEYALGLLAYLAAFAVAGVSATASIVLCLVVGLFFAIPTPDPETDAGR